MATDRLVACLTFLASVYLVLWGMHANGAALIGIGVLGCFAAYPLVTAWDEFDAGASEE